MVKSKESGWRRVLLVELPRASSRIDAAKKLDYPTLTMVKAKARPMSIEAQWLPSQSWKV